MIILGAISLAVLSGVFTYSALWALMPITDNRFLAEVQRDQAGVAAICVTLIVAISLGWWA